MNAVPSPVVTETWCRVLALALVLAGIYAWLYGDLVVRRVGLYVYLAAAGLLWAEVLTLELFNIHVGSEVVLATLALDLVGGQSCGNQTRRQRGPKFAHPPQFAILGVCLALVPVAFGVVLHIRATSTLHSTWLYDGGWPFVGAMAVTVVSCRVGAYLYRHSQPRLSAIYFFATVAAELVGVAGLLRVLGNTAVGRAGR